MKNACVVPLVLGLLSPLAASAEATISSITFGTATEDLLQYDYSATRSNRVVTITANVPYVAALKSGQPIPGIGEFTKPFRYQSPRLAFKILNTRRKAVYFTSLTVSDVKSQIDETPIPVFVNHVANGSVNINNQGWGPLLNAAVDVMVRPEIQCRQKEQRNLTVEHKSIGRIDDWGEVFLASDDIRARFGGSTACAAGVLTYNDVAGAAYRVPFMTTIYWGEALAGAGRPPQSSYSLSLQAGLSGYSKSIEISEEVAPQAADQFLISFASDRSARFSMEASLSAADGTIEDLGRVEIVYFRPRGAYVETPNSLYRQSPNGSDLPPNIRAYVTGVSQLPKAEAFMHAGRNEIVAHMTPEWSLAKYTKGIVF